VPFLAACAGAAGGGALARAAVALIYAVAVATDVLDGWVARRSGTASSRGQLFDHATDVLFVGSSLAFFAAGGRLSWWVPVAVLGAAATYAHALWRDGHAGDTQRARSPIGHAAGVLNYALVGLLGADATVAGVVPGWLLDTGAMTTAAANAMAIGGRLASLFWRERVKLADPRQRV
jgi:CDP-diacylglycerol--glycerol-3-phosphate 3-phosphatidyltransferase/cardiolipin synthase